MKRSIAQLVHKTNELSSQMAIVEGQDLFSSEIYKALKEMEENHFVSKMDPSRWQELRKQVNTQYTAFDKTLEPFSLTDIEYQVSLLIKCNIKPKSIAIITNRSKESITSIRRRLAGKHLPISGAPRPENWDVFIQSI